LNFVRNVKASTLSSIIYGETGVQPLIIDIKTRVISFWSNLIYPKSNKLTATMYCLLLSQFNNSNPVQKNNFLWLKNSKNIFITCVSGIWMHQMVINYCTTETF
jgi:hypothetical protein